MDPAQRRFLQLVPGGSLAVASSTSVLAQQPATSTREIVRPERLETEADWRQVRSFFPMAYDLTYFNAGGLCHQETLKERQPSLRNTVRSLGGVPKVPAALDFQSSDTPQQLREEKGSDPGSDPGQTQGQTRA